MRQDAGMVEREKGSVRLDLPRDVDGFAVAVVERYPIAITQGLTNFCVQCAIPVTFTLAG